MWDRFPLLGRMRMMAPGDAAFSASSLLRRLVMDGTLLRGTRAENLSSRHAAGDAIIASSSYLVSYRLRALLIGAMFATLTWCGRHFRLDDALIYARYVSHAYQGRGLYFNDGEPVNALTSILDTWLQLGLTYLLHGRALLAQAIIGGTFLFGALLMAEAATPFAGVLLAAGSYFYFYTGMETPLFVFLLGLTVWAYARGKDSWLPLMCVLCLLTRFEGGALLVVIAWQLWRQRRMPSAVSFVAPLLLVAIYLFCNLHIYGALLPQSASAKLGQGMSGFWGRWPTAFLRFPPGIFLPLGDCWVFAVILTILAWFGSRAPGMAVRNEVLIPFLVLLGSFYVLFNIPNYPWYYAPFLYFFYIYAARLIPESKDARVSVLIIAGCMALFSSWNLWHNGTENEAYARAGDWLSEHTAPGARIAAVETGTIGWHCDRYIIDVVGLTTPVNAHYTAERDFSSWIKERPDYIVVHFDGRFPWEKVALASPDYEFLPVKFDSVGILRRRTSPSSTAFTPMRH